jgi:hypothetical protein
MSAWGVGATSTLLLLLHGHEIARGTLAPLGGLGSAAPWIVVASIAAADLSMTVFCTARSLEMPRLAAPGRAWPRLALAPPRAPHPTPTPPPPPPPPHPTRARTRTRFPAGLHGASSLTPAWGVITHPPERERSPGCPDRLWSHHAAPLRERARAR